MNEIISATSYKADSPGLLLDGNYDIAFFVSSWEARSLCFVQANSWQAALSVLMLFDDSDKQGLRAENDQLMIESVNKVSEQTEIIRGRSIDVDTVWDSIYTIILSRVSAVGRPLRVLLDSTTCPRYYFLAILGACIREGLSSSVSIVYSEGIYPCIGVGRNGPEEIEFTDGNWKAIAVPFFEGAYSPNKTRFYYVSLGFEGWKTLRVISRADPDRLSALMPNPGFQKDYADRASANNHELITQYCIPYNQIVNAEAGDAVAAWKAMTEAKLERPDRENTFYLCCGTKPHSLALGLRALVLDSAALLYNLPRAHFVVPVEPNGTFWRYDVFSMSVAANLERT